MNVRILNWAGSKKRLVEITRSLLPPHWANPHTCENYYVEPFLGSGALFLAFEPQNAALGDACAPLINLWTALQVDPQGVADAAERFARDHTKVMYYVHRTWFNDTNQEARQDTDVNQAARMIYLNSKCYNGLWRVNKSGGFNVPIHCDHMTRKLPTRETLLAVGHYLQNHNVEIVNQNFQGALEMVLPDELVILDPPYVPKSLTANFTSYTPGGFGAQEHVVLAKMARRATGTCAYVIAYNTDCEYVRDLYAGFRLVEVELYNSISIKTKARGKRHELIILNYDEDGEFLKGAM